MARLPSNLTGKQRRFLRALAHSLKPTLQIGLKGLTPGVTAELDRALETHELIKVKLDADQAPEALSLRDAIESGAHCHVVQHIGRTFVVYRERAKDPKIALPGVKQRDVKA
ncbi:MAG TPA: ribosome assembly RNA-binding protein YhbY [Polyangiaceae bacterium]|nr:ribosome assembly RNA-binding protein YhbY [Polyangiaceae bacterium]HMR76667.1 ribosome assembly RNA-binding protein YhbY [Polyangiaceae bacterium]